MKRFLFLLLILSTTLGSTCQSAPQTNTAGVNVNLPVNVNSGESLGPLDKANKAVAVVLIANSDGTKEIVVSQKTIKIKKNVEKLRFDVINNLNEEVGNVTMPFAATDPFDGTPPFVASGPIGAGDSKTSQTRKAKNIPDGKYKYWVKVRDKNGNPIPGLPDLDPEVEISN